MEYEYEQGRLFLKRNAQEKTPLINRLSRIEGQVRGFRQMVEEDRYCLGEVPQANAIIAAMREFTLLVIFQHFTAGIKFATEDGNADSSINDVMAVLRTALRLETTGRKRAGGE